MKIYFVHSQSFDFRKDFYEPFEDSVLAKSNELVFPHKTDHFVHSKQIIRDVDLVIAEVSYPSTGLGIELGWAEALEKPVIAVHRPNVALSKSLDVITNTFVEYKDREEMVNKVVELVG